MRTRDLVFAQHRVRVASSYFKLPARRIHECGWLYRWHLPGDQHTPRQPEDESEPNHLTGKLAAIAFTSRSSAVMSSKPQVAHQGDVQAVVSRAIEGHCNLQGFVDEQHRWHGGKVHVTSSGPCLFRLRLANICPRGTAFHKTLPSSTQKKSGTISRASSSIWLQQTKGTGEERLARFMKTPFRRDAGVNNERTHLSRS